MTSKKAELEKLVDDLRIGAFADMQNRVEDLEGDNTSEDFKEHMEQFESELENMIGTCSSLLEKVKVFNGAA